MSEQLLDILQVTTEDARSGAGLSALALCDAYRRRGHRSFLAVGRQHGRHPDVRVVPRPELHAAWRRWWFAAESDLASMGRRVRGMEMLRGVARTLAEPGKALDHHLGIEDFRFPGTWELLALTGRRPDLVHCHNLHGGYFDLRALSWLSHRVPVVLTLHDAWLLSGHCAHSLDCERWKTGCGRCPDLSLYPAVRRDATAYNWRRKREIFRKSRLYVATPCRWLMRNVEESMLRTAIVDARVIPNGVDLTVFHPGPQESARESLGLRQDAAVILFAANAVRENVWKDFPAMRHAVGVVADQMPERDLVFVALGEEAPPERIGRAAVHFVPYQPDPHAVARYYQAADVYVHAARADTFPNTVLEALACGTPVVATAVGGIPEQIEEAETGFLVPPGSAEGLAVRLAQLVSDPALRQRMGREAARSARRFDLDLQADAYLEWYQQLVRRQRVNVS